MFIDKSAMRKSVNIVLLICFKKENKREKNIVKGMNDFGPELIFSAHLKG